MKINYLYLFIIIVITGLLAWGGYTLSDYNDRNYYVAITLFVSLTITGIGGLAIEFEEHRSGVMIRTTCWIFFLLALIADYIFACFHFNIPLFIICNGLIVLIAVLIVNGIYKTKV